MFRQYHGNDMELLRHLACEVLAHDPPPPLGLEHVVVPNTGMAKWLRQGVAGRLGIAARLSCDLPARFLDRLAGLLLGPAEAVVARAYAKEQLGLRIMALLPGLLDVPEFEPLRSYLSDRRDPRRLLALSRQLAVLFDQYLVYRPAWVAAWEAGAPAPQEPEREHPWQPLLWRVVCERIAQCHPGTLHGATRNARLVEVLRGPAAPSGLPARVSCFGLGALTPALLDTLTALGQHIDVHLFHFNPCEEFWAEIVSERTLARWRLMSPGRAEHAESGNRLLASWGALGRRQLQVLLDATDGDLSAVFRQRPADSLLHEVQNDILALRQPLPVPLAPGDTSIVLAEAHSRLREVEALHDALLGICERLPGLRPRDIVVMAPDIAAYAAHVEAVFGELRGDPRYLPYTIADRARSTGSAVARSFLHLLALPDSRFTASEVCGLLAVPAIAERFALTPPAVEELRELVHRSGTRWGIGEANAVGTGPVLERNTWRFGLSRLLLGVALEDGVLYDGVAPLPPESSERMEQAGILAEFVALLTQWAEALQAPRTAAAWQADLERLLADFYAEGSGSGAEITELRVVLGTVFESLAEAGVEDPIPREALGDLVSERLAEPDGAHAFLRGGVSFCQLTPLRCIPFRVVCLLGMNAEDFPRNRERTGFDLMGLHPASGDPSRRDDDRYLFLEALLAARDCLYISRVARDERTDAEREAAVPLSELRDYLDLRHGAGTAAGLTQRHHLKPFHEDYFRSDATLPSYREEWLPAAGAGADGCVPFCHQPLPPLPPDALSLASLEHFYRNPCRGFFSGRFNVQFAEAESPVDDCEPIEPDHLQKHAIRSRLLDAALGANEIGTQEFLLASGELPLGASGYALLREESAKVETLASRLRERMTAPSGSVDVEFSIDGRPLRGVLQGIRGGCLLDYTASTKAPAGRLVVFWIRHLVGCAAGVITGASELHDVESTHTLSLCTREEASQRLADLIALRDEGLCHPLPLFPRSARAWVGEMLKSADRSKAANSARKEFSGGYNRDGECLDPHVARAWPDADTALDDRFEALANRVFAPLLRALAEGSP